MWALWLELVSYDSSGRIHMSVHCDSSWSIMTAVGEFTYWCTVTRAGQSRRHEVVCVCTVTLRCSGKREATEGDTPDSKRRLGEVKRLVSIKDGFVEVTTKSGDVCRYKAKVLEAMLVKLHGFSAQKAVKMCLGFGMDPRPRPKQRMQSCACGGSASDEYHRFPHGFSFTVKEKYAEFARDIR